MMTDKRVYTFGAFQLDSQQKILLREGERLPLHPKTFATLLTLVESGGAVITKDELLAKIWPDTFVEESSLTKNIALLRKALRNGHDHSDYIETIPTIGYRFIAPVRMGDTENRQAGEAPQEATAITEPNHASPMPLPWRGHWLWGLCAIAFLCCVAAAMYWRRPSSTPAPITSIAVMPFRNASGDAEQDYFADGLTEHLIRDLSRLKDFKVIARNSAFRFKGKPVDWRTAGAQLNVAAILEGSIKRSGDRLQINVILRSTRDGRVIWASERNDKDLADIIAIEKEIGCSVTANLQAILCNDESSRIETNNIEAYLAYLKGLYQFNLRTSTSLKKAISYFEEAVALDPNFAEGWAAVADAYFVGKWYIPLPPEIVVQKGGSAAQRAWALDQHSAHACSMMGIYLSDTKQQAESDKFAAKVPLLNPNFAQHYHSMALYLALIGRYDEGIRFIKKTQQLDPLSLVVNTDVGYAYYIARRYDEAIAAYRHALSLDENFSLAHLLLGLALTQKGQHDEAITEVQRATDRGSEYLAALGNVYARAGKRTEALAVFQQLQQLARAKYVPPYQIAWVYCGLGDVEQALPLMQQSIAKNVGVIDFKHHPIYEPLLADARYQELLRKASFPW